MKQVWMDDLGYWVEAKIGFVVEVSEDEFKELMNQEAEEHYSKIEWLKGRKCLALDGQGKFSETTVC
jgi:hypothetical protein